MKRYSFLYALVSFVLCASVFGDVTYYLNESFETPVSGGYKYLYKYNGGTVTGDLSTTFDSSTWTYARSEDYIGGDQGYGVASATFTPGAYYGSQVLFVQRAGTMSTTISGLTAGQTYNIGYYYTQRGAENPNISTAVDGTFLIDHKNYNDLPSNIDTSNLYHASGNLKFASGSFTAAGDTATFSVTNYSTGDQTVSFDKVYVTNGAAVVSPNTWVAKKWTSAADSGVVADGTYTHAYNFGTTEAVTLNGIEFTGASRTNTGNSIQKATGNLSFIATGNHNGGWDATAGPSDTASASIAKETTYGFRNIVLNGLEPGATYETTIYLRNFGATDPRSGTFTLNGDTSPVTNAGQIFGATQGSSGTVTHTGVANDEGVIYIQVNNFSTANTFHLSGVSNRYVSSAAGYNDNVFLSESFTGTSNARLETLNTETGANAYITGTKWSPRGNYATFNLTNSDNVAKAGANGGMGLTTDLTGAYKIRLSADVKVGNLEMGGSNAAQCVRGVGLGFFDKIFGQDGGEVGRGFSGIAVMPNGTILYYDNQTNDIANAQTSQVAYSGVSFNGNSWTNLALDLEILDGGYKARILGVQLDGSTADYSSLIGKVFNTTDLVGFTGSSSKGSTYGYLDNLQLRVLETSTSEIRAQQLGDSRTEYLAGVAARNHKAFAATSFTGAASTSIVDVSPMDLTDKSSVPMAWETRGWNSNNRIPHLETNQLVMTNNMAVMSDINLAEVLENKQGFILSVDVATHNLSAETTVAKVSGLGVGFFSKDIGTTYASGNDLVDRGFNGIIIRPDGGLQFFLNDTDTGSGTNSGGTPNYGTDPIAYGGTFDKYAMETLMMTLEPNAKGGLTLVDLSFGDSTADYSALLGKELSMTDMVGFLARSANSWEYVGLIDNFSIETYVPEPAAWSLLLLGILGLGLWRRKRS